MTGRQSSDPGRGSIADPATDPLEGEDLKTLSYNAATIRSRISQLDLDRIHAEIQRAPAAQMDVSKLRAAEATDDLTTAIGVNPITRLMQIRDRMESQDYGEALLALEEVLAENPEHGIAKFLAGQCREYLSSLYSLHFADRRLVPRVDVRVGDLASKPLGLRGAFLVSRIDGEASIDELMDMAGMPELEAFHTLYELSTQGVISFGPARVVKVRAPTTSRRDERERMLTKICAAQGRPAITRAISAYIKAGHEVPANDQDVQVQMLEQVDEAEVRLAIARLHKILENERPQRADVLQTRLQRLKDAAEDEETRQAATSLLGQLKAIIES